MTIAPAKSKFTENLERKETNASAAKSWIGNYTSPTQFIEESMIRPCKLEVLFSCIKEQINRSISVSLMMYIITRTSISRAYSIIAQ